MRFESDNLGKSKRRDQGQMKTIVRRTVELGIPSNLLTAISLMMFDATMFGGVLAYAAYVLVALAVYWTVRVESNRYVRVAGFVINAGFAAWSVALWVRCS